MSKLLRGAIWIAIGALIAAALVCVIWVLIGDQAGIIGRAFLTILLLAAFAGIAIAESHLAARRPEWLALASMVTWIIALLVGAVKIWLPQDDEYFGWASERFFQLLLVIGILQLALVHPRLFVKAAQRYVTTFTRVIVIVTFVMLTALVALLVFYLTFPDLFRYDDLYWRITIAVGIIAAVGTMLIPLLNALFAPRARTADTAPHPYAAVTGAPSAVAAPVTQAWPTYADGRTPLPVMPDGSPDWNAYYTGYPTYAPAPQGQPTAQQAPQPQASPQPEPPRPPAAEQPQPPPQPQAAPQPAPPRPPAPEQPQPPLPPTSPQPPAPSAASTPPPQFVPGDFPQPPPAAPEAPR
ncbi:hypothetical protein [Microbacterium sp. NPDC058345]|uniref:hypothetical protein n=1 Tax=Microbacterium sp. NPDC058345 TaxID=3346455 RepID=UPI0036632C72